MKSIFDFDDTVGIINKSNLDFIILTFDKVKDTEKIKKEIRLVRKFLSSKEQESIFKKIREGFHKEYLLLGFSTLIEGNAAIFIKRNYKLSLNFLNDEEWLSEILKIRSL